MTAQYKWLTILAVILGSCGLKDDPIKIREGRSYCQKFAEQHMRDTYGNFTLSFGKALNTSDDPTTSTFEFIWDHSYISSEPSMEGLFVVCRGNAKSREIAYLSLSGKVLRDMPRKY